MALTFANIPGNIRVPFWYGEVRAGVQGFQQDSTLLLIHLKNDSGSAVADRIYPILNGNEDQLFGADSPVAQMIKVARRNAPFQTIAAAGQAQIPGGTAGAGSVTFNGAASRAYSASFYIGGKLVRFAVSQGDTAAQQATKMAAAITAATSLSLPLAAVVAGGTPTKVDLTAKLKGPHINTVRVETGLSIDDDPYLDSLVTIVQPTGGVGATDITNVLANAGDTEYDWIALGYDDTANVGKLEDFLNDVAGRWGPYSQKYGHGFWAKSDTPGNLTTLGQSRNSQHVSLRGEYRYSTPSYINIAALAANAAAHLSTFPEGSRPLQTLPLYGVIGPKDPLDRFTVQTRNTLYYSGVSADAYDPVGGVMIDRVLTSYQQNQWGSPDTTFLDVNTMAQVMYAMRRFKADMTQTYGRVALTDDNPYGIDSQVTTEDIRKLFIHTYQKLVEDGCLENADLFAEGLQVERDANDANRVNASLPLDMVNQLRIVAVAAIVNLQLQGA